MRRNILLGLATVSVVVLAARRAKDVRTAQTELLEAAQRTAELESVARLLESQQAATVDLIARLADGRMSLDEVVDVLESNAKGQPNFLSYLALIRNESTDRERLAGFARDRAEEFQSVNPVQLPSGPFQWSR